MNQIRATVRKIESEGILHWVKFDFFGIDIAMVSLELDEKIQVGVEVSLSIKPTAVSIAKELSLEQENILSFSNFIPAQITSIDDGIILSSVLMDSSGFEIESIISTEACRRMKLEKQDKVLMLIKASEVSTTEIVND